MKALLHHCYGAPSNLTFGTLDKPKPEANQVLVRIKATTVNDYDWSMARGKPFLYRLMFGLIKPKNPVMGMELAGIVESIGSAVREFQVGDEVMGDTSDYGFGCYAEFMAIDERAVRHKPKQISFAEAASIPHAGLLALQGFSLANGPEDGQKILINGAGGGMGIFAIQIAKRYDVDITGVDAAAKKDHLFELGCHHFIDYQNTDFTSNGLKYDLILDARTTRNPWRYLRSLSAGGSYISVGGYLPKLFLAFILGPILKILFAKDVKILALKPNERLEEFLELYLSDQMKCIIDGPYPLAEGPRLVQKFGDGKHLGKIVLEI